MFAPCSVTSAQGSIGWQTTGTGVCSHAAIAAVKTQTQQISSADDTCMQQVNSFNYIHFKTWISISHFRHTGYEDSFK